MIYWLVFICFALACVVWLFVNIRNAGEDKAKREALEEKADDIYTAKKAHDLLNADPTYLARVRNTFLRKK